MWPVNSVGWIDSAKKVVELISVTLAPVIALVLARIAYKQQKTNELKIRADLYDRRISVFNAVTDLLGAVGVSATIEFEQLRTFLQKTRESYFLFGSEIPDYLDRLYKAGVDFRHQDKKLISNLPVGPERTALAEANGELGKWFLDQFEESRKKFEPYLNLT